MILRLRERGWSDDEIAHLRQHFVPSKESRLFVALMTVLLAAAVVLIPYGYLLLGVYIPFAILNAVLIVVGLPLGAAFALLLIDLDRLDRAHHLTLLVLLPLLMVLTLILLFSRFAAISSSNALIGGVLYAVSFSAPYAFLIRQEWNSRIGPLRL